MIMATTQITQNTVKPSGATSQAPIVVKGDKPSVFGQLVDTVNPLQHVPGVSQAYRHYTGDKISETSKFLGHVGIGAAVGGPIGAAIGAGVFVLEKIIGGLFKGHKEPANDNAPIPVSVKPEGQGRSVATNNGKAPSTNNGSPLAFLTGKSPIVTPANAQPLRKDATIPGLSKPVQMDSAQFAALLGAFGQSVKDDQAKAVSQNKQDDFANTFQKNLDKLEALKKTAASS